MKQLILSKLANASLPVLISSGIKIIVVPLLAIAANGLTHWCVRHHLEFLLKWASCKLDSSQCAFLSEHLSEALKLIYPEIQKIWWLKWMTPDLVEKYLAEILHDWNKDISGQTNDASKN